MIISDKIYRIKYKVFMKDNSKKVAYTLVYNKADIQTEINLTLQEYKRCGVSKEIDKIQVFVDNELRKEYTL